MGICSRVLAQLFSVIQTETKLRRTKLPFDAWSSTGHCLNWRTKNERTQQKMTSRYLRGKGHIFLYRRFGPCLCSVNFLFCELALLHDLLSFSMSCCACMRRYLRGKGHIFLYRRFGPCLYVLCCRLRFYLYMA